MNDPLGNWFTTGVIASWWSPLILSWVISCFITKDGGSWSWVVLECPLIGDWPFLGDTILVTILFDLPVDVVLESTLRFEASARFLSRFLVFYKKGKCNDQLYIQCQTSFILKTLAYNGRSLVSSLAFNKWIKKYLGMNKKKDCINLLKHACLK